MYKQASRKAGSDDKVLIIGLTYCDMELLKMGENLKLELSDHDLQCKEVVFHFDDPAKMPGGLRVLFDDNGTIWLNGEFIGESKEACRAARGISKWNTELTALREGVTIGGTTIGAPDEDPFKVHFILSNELFFTLTSKTSVPEALAKLRQWGEEAVSRNRSIARRDGLPLDLTVQREAANITHIWP